VRARQWEKHTGVEPFNCFIPAPLPPHPPLEWTEKLTIALDRATRALAGLDGIVGVLPSPGMLLYTYIRKEAVLSSQIEGTQSSLSDLLLYETKQAPGVPVSDVREVSSYVAALEHGLRRLKSGFPLSLRLIREIHTVLLKNARGGDKQPGEFRRSQNWIGGTRPGNASYVPPPPREVLPAMGALEKFIHGEPVQTPPLLKSCLVHAQFESIHPFLDGNGRMGRLLIPFILYTDGAQEYPFLFLSLYFKQHRTDYYDALQAVRTHGRWEEWLMFYFTGVEEVAQEAALTSKKLVKIFGRDRENIKNQGRASASMLTLQTILEKRCLLSLPVASKESGLSFPTISQAMGRLREMGIVKEVSGKRKGQVFAYQAYWKLISRGTGD